MQQCDAGKKAGALEVFRFDTRCGLGLTEGKEPHAERTGSILVTSLDTENKIRKSRYMYKRRETAMERKVAISPEKDASDESQKTKTD